MRTRDEIERRGRELWQADKRTTFLMYRLLLEVSLDIRDLLAEKRNRKVVTTEVPLTEKEQELLDNLDRDHA